MGVTKMGNIMPRAGIESTSLAFQASVLKLHHVGLPDVTTIPILPIYAAPLPRRSVQPITIVPLEL